MFTFSIITASYKRKEKLEALHNSILGNKNYLFNIEWVVIVEEEDIETIRFLKSVSQNEIKIKIVNNIYKSQFNKLITSLLGGIFYGGTITSSPVVK